MNLPGTRVYYTPLDYYDLNPELMLIWNHPVSWFFCALSATVTLYWKLILIMDLSETRFYYKPQTIVNFYPKFLVTMKFQVTHFYYTISNKASLYSSYIEAINLE